MISNIFEYFKIAKKLGADIAYTGVIGISCIEGLGETLRKQMDCDKLPLFMAESIFSVFVELMNNVHMHSAEKTNGAECGGISKGAFVLTSEDGVYYIQSGNLIKTENTAPLKDRIDYLNSMDKHSLRKYYMEQIRKKNINSESSGAGIGLIDIAKRASAPIGYSFIPYDADEGFVFFSVCVAIDEHTDVNSIV